jgi:N-glycosylase/DNA lyase
MNHHVHLTHDRIENAVMKVCDYVVSQRQLCTQKWEDYKEHQLWSELVSCILGSRVRCETARACTLHLRNAGLLRISTILKNPKVSEKRMKHELNKSIYPPFSNGKGSKYRYPKSKSRCIVRSGFQIYGDNLSIRETLKKCHDGQEARNLLRKKCAGIGPKQASLFLRNISFSDDLAILDCHVLRYMKLLRLDEKFNDIEQEKSHPYIVNENILKLYAISKRKSLSVLDVGIWVVMRFLQRRL